jgi:hypothetical protein
VFKPISEEHGSLVLLDGPHFLRYGVSDRAAALPYMLLVPETTGGRGEGGKGGRREDGGRKAGGRKEKGRGKEDRKAVGRREGERREKGGRTGGGREEEEGVIKIPMRCQCQCYDSRI